MFFFEPTNRLTSRLRGRRRRGRYRRTPRSRPTWTPSGIIITITITITIIIIIAEVDMDAVWQTPPHSRDVRGDSFPRGDVAQRATIRSVDATHKSTLLPFRTSLADAAARRATLSSSFPSE